MSQPSCTNLIIHLFQHLQVTQQRISESISTKYSDAGIRMRLSAEVKAYRQSAVRTIARANVSFTSFGDMIPWIDSIAKDSLTLGKEADLAREHATNVKDCIVEEIVNLIQLKCFKGYSTIFDGTSSFAPAEAIIIRIVTLDYQIIQLLVKVGLFQGTLNGDAVANHLLATLTGTLGLNLKDWLVTMQDRARTNGSALRKICDLTLHATPSKADCMSHTFNNTANEMISNKKKRGVYCELFRKCFQSIIQFSGKARDRASSVFQETAKDAGGVRFFRHFEQLLQLNKYGLKSVIEDIVKPVLKDGSSEASCRTMLSNFDGNEMKAHLGMAMVECAAISDFGKPLCIACYSLEGDSPLILSAHDILKRIDHIVNAIDNHPLPSVEKVVEEASTLIQSRHGFLVREAAISKEDYDLIDNSKATLEMRISEVSIRRESTFCSSRGRRRNPSAKASGTVDVIDQQLNDLRTELDNLIPSYNEAKDKYNEKKGALDVFENEFKYVSEDDLIAYSKTLMKPAVEYYNDKFNSCNGDLFKLKQAVRVAQLFDPFYVKDKSAEALKLLADDLKYFGYEDIFTDAFITNLKNEIPALLADARKDFDWEQVGNCKQYQTRSMNRAKRRNLHLDHEPGNRTTLEEDWKKDPGERASRIWEWWRKRIHETKNPKLKFFARAVRAVVLTQLSSCAVERVFSQLKLIRDACGDNMMEDMLEIRMFERCNGDLSIFGDVNNE